MTNDELIEAARDAVLAAAGGRREGETIVAMLSRAALATKLDPKRVAAYWRRRVERVPADEAIALFEAEQRSGCAPRRCTAGRARFRATMAAAARRRRPWLASQIDAHAMSAPMRAVIGAIARHRSAGARALDRILREPISPDIAIGDRAILFRPLPADRDALRVWAGTELGFADYRRNLGVSALTPPGPSDPAALLAQIARAAESAIPVCLRVRGEIGGIPWDFDRVGFGVDGLVIHIIADHRQIVR